MKKQLILAAVVVLGVAVLGAISASAWTASGYVYIDQSTSEPAPCVTIELYVGDECTGYLIGLTTTDNFGYWSFEDLEWDEISVQMVFDPPEDCFCVYDPWPHCKPAKQCEQLLSTGPTTVDFDLNQDYCDCD